MHENIHKKEIIEFSRLFWFKQSLVRGCTRKILILLPPLVQILKETLKRGESQLDSIFKNLKRNRGEG